MTSRSHNPAFTRVPLADLPKAPFEKTPTISQVIEQIVLNAQERPLELAIESTFCSLLDVDKAFCFMESEKKDSMFCSSLYKWIPMTNSLIWSTYTKKVTQFFRKPSTYPQYNVLIDPTDLPSIYIPLLDSSSNAVGVIIIARRLEFSSKDKEKMDKFPARFSLYFDYLLNVRENQAPENSSFNAIRDHFGAKKVDLLKYNGNNFQLFDIETNTYETILYPGCAENCLKNGVPEMLMNVKASAYYVSTVDGITDEPVLLQPFKMEGCNFAFVLRGKTNNTHYTLIDHIKLEALTPLILSELSKSDAKPEELESSIFSNRLQALLQVAEVIFGVLDIDSLIPTIMDKACSLLNTERCSLFIIDKATNELVTRFHGGLNKAIRVKNGVGIAGYTAMTGNYVNITEAYNDPRFDKTSDLQTGFHTNTLLTVPIYDNRGNIAGVTEMINRNDGKVFDDDDIQMMKAFNVFCGISLDNANLYNTSLQLMNQLKGFVQTSATLGKEKQINKILLEILETMKTVVNGVFAIIYSYDNETDTIAKLIATGKVDVDETFTRIIINERLQKAFQLNNDDPLDGPISLSSVKPQKNNPSILRFDVKPLALSNEIDLKSNKLLGFPLLTNDNILLGAVLVGTNNIVLTEDFKLLSCFSVFAALSMEKDKLQQVATLGQSEVRIKKLLNEDEKGVSGIPKSLQIDPLKAETIFTIAFDAPRWDGLGHFRVIFQIFNHYGLLQHFHIRNEIFLHFIYEISSQYNKVPYHNWRHAVDVTQFVSYQILVAKLDQVLTKLELFCLLIASICHDVNHDGFTNVFNEKAETPLGILFKNQSVMETHHCQIAINISTKQECNIFAEFDTASYSQIWSIIIHLILATDMAKHHSTLQTANQKLDQKPMNHDNPEDRFLIMELILKCGDISNVSRPFELADKWCDVLCEEFFRQGDLEKTNGLEYTSPLNDRAHLDKPKSQIGFYTFVCLPLFQTAARAIPALQVNVDQVNSNLAVWKSRV